MYNKIRFVDIQRTNSTAYRIPVGKSLIVLNHSWSIASTYFRSNICICHRHRQSTEGSFSYTEMHHLRGKFNLRKKKLHKSHPHNHKTHLRNHHTPSEQSLLVTVVIAIILSKVVVIIIIIITSVPTPLKFLFPTPPPPLPSSTCNHNLRQLKTLDHSYPKPQHYPQT
jgi:hypothetical protein